MLCLPANVPHFAATKSAHRSEPDARLATFRVRRVDALTEGGAHTSVAQHGPHDSPVARAITSRQRVKIGGGETRRSMRLERTPLRTGWEYRGDMCGDTRDNRLQDPPDRSALAAYLRWHLADHAIAGLQLDAELHVSPLSAADSARTWLLRLGGAEFVLQRPRAAAQESSADAVAREFRWLSALHPVYPLAPRPFLLCDDASVIGRPFYVMERRRGLAVHSEEPVTLAGHPDVRRHLSESVVDALVSLHALAWDDRRADGEASAGFVDRQVRAWIERWRHTPHDTVVDMDAMALWLAAHEPDESLEPAVIHGDFTLGNLLLNPLNPAVITAVLDWEAVALGDPLWDVGVLLAHWAPPLGDGGLDAFSTVTSSEGYLTRDDLIQRYSARSGRDLSEVAFYEAFALFRRAVASQERIGRSSADAAGHNEPPRPDEPVRALARRARALIG